MHEWIALHRNRLKANLEQLERLIIPSGFRALTMVLVKIVSVKPVGGYKLQFAFSDGPHGEQDFSPLVQKNRSVLAASGPGLPRPRFPSAGRAGLAEWLRPHPWAIHDEVAGEGTLIRPPHAV